LSLWDWASAAYAAPGTKALCLELQDRHGQCVSLLLWAAWAAQSGRVPTRSAVREAAILAAAWDTGVIGPLRQARRALGALPGPDESERRRLRDQVLSGELAAERALLAALGTLSPAEQGAPGQVLAALKAASAAWGAPVPRAGLASLAEAIEGA
jgi:uncharacterized protein (TIGR02444 family)